MSPQVSERWRLYEVVPEPSDGVFGYVLRLIGTEYVSRVVPQGEEVQPPVDQLRKILVDERAGSGHYVAYPASHMVELEVEVDPKVRVRRIGDNYADNHDPSIVVDIPF